MSLLGTIVLRPNEFSQPDYSVIYKDPEGRELSVGRIFYSESRPIQKGGRLQSEMREAIL